jgi:hypothetical protein
MILISVCVFARHNSRVLKYVRVEVHCLLSRMTKITQHSWIKLFEVSQK